MSDNARENRIRKALDEMLFGIPAPAEPETKPTGNEVVDEAVAKTAAKNPPGCCEQHDLLWLSYRMEALGIMPDHLTREEIQRLGKALVALMHEAARMEAMLQRQGPASVLDAMAPENEGDTVVLGGPGAKDPEVVRGMVASLREMGAHKLADVLAKQMGLPEEKPPRVINDMEVTLSGDVRLATLNDGGAVRLVEEGVSFEKGGKSVVLNPVEVAQAVGTMLAWTGGLKSMRLAIELTARTVMDAMKAREAGGK